MAYYSLREKLLSHKFPVMSGYQANRFFLSVVLAVHAGVSESACVLSSQLQTAAALCPTDEYGNQCACLLLVNSSFQLISECGQIKTSSGSKLKYGHEAQRMDRLLRIFCFISEKWKLRGSMVHRGPHEC